MRNVARAATLGLGSRLGFIVVGLPYAATGLMDLSALKGGSPLGAGTIAGPKGERQPSATELELARFQGRHVAVTFRRLQPRLSWSYSIRRSSSSLTPTDRCLPLIADCNGFASCWNRQWMNGTLTA